MVFFKQILAIRICIAPLKFTPTIRMLGASDQDQVPYLVHSLSSSLSVIVHIDFWYAQFPSWDILFKKLSGLTRFCNQPIYCPTYYKKWHTIHIITLSMKHTNTNVLLQVHSYLILQRTSDAVAWQIYLICVKSGYCATGILANTYCQAGVDSHV